MERLNSLKITFVFIITIIIPSVFLSAFAYQAIEGERIARRVERRRHLLDEAHALARELDESLRAPGREARDGCARLRGKLRRPQDAALPLRATELALSGSVAAEGSAGEAGLTIFAADGWRVYPARRSVPSRTGEAQAASAALGGPTLSAGRFDPVSVLNEARALVRSEGGRSRAMTLLNRLDLGAPLPTSLAVKLELARLLTAEHDEAETALAAKELTELTTRPLDALDSLGRPVVALARFEYALVALAGRQRTVYRERLAALVRDLEVSAAYLPKDDLCELVTRAGTHLQDEGREWDGEARRAADIADARRRLESRAERQEELFGADIREVIRAARTPRAAARPVSPPDANRWFLRRRTGERQEVVLLGPLERADGSLMGIAAFPVDLDATARRLAAERIAAHRADSETAFDVISGPAGSGDDLDEARAPLAYPLEDMVVVAQAREQSQEVLTREGTTMKLWLIALSIGGVFAGAVVTVRTVLREAKAAELKSDFVTNVTHELRTPLTSIRMFIETLELGRVDSEEERKECLSIMARETDRLTRLIERLLSFSKIESRKWRFRFSYAPPIELVHEAIRLLRQQLQVKENDPFPVEVETVQAVAPVAVDRDAIVEVILNLLTNAWKYTPALGRRIRIVVRSLRRQVVIDVEDNGIGVPRRDRRRIWRKFERGSNAEKGRVEGSGIGLTLALSIAKGHGGTIVLTPLKQGSRFTLVLPKV